MPESRSQTDQPANGRLITQGVGRAVATAVALWTVGVGGGVIIAGLTGFLAAASGFAGPGGVPPLVSLVAQYLFAGALFCVGAGYAARWLDGYDWQLGEIPSGRLVGVGVAGSLAVWGVQRALSTVGDVQLPESTIGLSAADGGHLALLMVYIVFIAPIAEETLFRGAIQRRLRVVLGRWPAVVLASGPFLSIHALNFTGGSMSGLALSFATLFGVSLVLGYVYDRAETLLTPIVVHAVYNGLLISGALVTGL